MFEGELREAEQRAYEDFDLRRLLAPEGPEQALGLDLGDLLEGVMGRERRNPQTVITQRFSEDAAHPEHDHRPEDRIARETGNELALAREHGLDEDAFKLIPGCAHDGMGGAFDRCLGGKVQMHQTALGLVEQGGPQALEDHGIAQGVRELDGL